MSKGGEGVKTEKLVSYLFLKLLNGLIRPEIQRSFLIFFEIGVLSLGVDSKTPKCFYFNDTPPKEFTQKFPSEGLLDVDHDSC